jgi:hypothetical protein
MACNVGNAYLNALCCEKTWFVARPEFGSQQGMVSKVLVQACYGLKLSGASWRSMFDSTPVLEMGFESTVADSHVYRRANAKPDGFRY